MASTTKKADDVGTEQVQKQADTEQSLGFVGVKVDPLPNSAHSQESGPDAPSAVADPNSRVVQHSAADPKESK